MNAITENHRSAPERTIDFSRFFLPSFLTPLYHTPCYRLLNPEQKLRYNQLHALYFQEQIMFFERALADNVLEPFLAEDLPDKLKSGLKEFIAEERSHSAMFLKLNRLCSPDLYSGKDFYFIRLPWLGSKLLNIISRRPKTFPLFLWLALMQEERSMFFARTFLDCNEDLEPHFLNLQRIHLSDEVGHVHCDEEILDWLWPRTPAWLRRFNVRLLGWMMGEYFSHPKRAGLRVLDKLVDEFPELKIHHPLFHEQILNLKDNLSYCSSLYNRENIPKTLARFDTWPEFRKMTPAMPGYQPISP